MISLVKARTMSGLSLLALAVLLLVLSVMLAAPDAEARKKKRINTVQCVVSQPCFGTNGRDRLLGTDSKDSLISLGGNDVLRANGGADDTLQGGTGSDLYTGYDGNFGSDLIKDAGGSADFLDLSSLSLFDDVSLVRDEDPTDLIVDGPGLNDVELDGYFGLGKIERIKFADATVTATQSASLIREIALAEQAAVEEHLPESDGAELGGPTQADIGRR